MSRALGSLKADALKDVWGNYDPRVDCLSLDVWDLKKLTVSQYQCIARIYDQAFEDENQMHPTGVEDIEKMCAQDQGVKRAYVVTLSEEGAQKVKGTSANTDGVGQKRMEKESVWERCRALMVLVEYECDSSISEWAKSRWVLQLLAVTPEQQGKGLGSVLLECAARLVQHQQGQGQIGTIAAFTREQDRRTQRWYAKCAARIDPKRVYGDEGAAMIRVCWNVDKMLKALVYERERKALSKKIAVEKYDSMEASGGKVSGEREWASGASGVPGLKWHKNKEYGKQKWQS